MFASSRHGFTEQRVLEFERRRIERHEFNRYCLLESVTNYLLADSRMRHIVYQQREPAGNLISTKVDDSAAVPVIEAVGRELPLSEIYRRVEFNAS